MTGSGRSFFPSLQPTSIVRSDSAAAASRSRFPICSRGFLGISAVVAPPWVFTARLSPHQIDISLSPSQKLSPSFLPRLLLSLYPIELKSLPSLIPLRSSSAIGPPFYQQLPASVSIGRAHRPQRNRRPPAAAGAPSPSPIDVGCSSDACISSDGTPPFDNNSFPLGFLSVHARLVQRRPSVQAAGLCWNIPSSFFIKLEYWFKEEQDTRLTAALCPCDELYSLAV
uniref:Uncharacterized protein n=1 Tax=Oryza rufipogon TaxID=4529 RepID=A0A0E0P875_ORYRU